jgi:glycine/D-amino acid oxidase-like deaminating enzyme
MQPVNDAEVLIIGGGIAAGVAIAYHLAQYGRQVTLLERGEIASEASGVNSGHIGAMGWGNLPDLNSYLTMGSLEIFKSLQLDLGYDIEFRQSGCLEAIHTEEQYEYDRDRVLRLRSGGFTLELLTTREARGIEPELSPDLLGCVYTPWRAQANPVKATRALAAAAQSKGVCILTNHEVIAIHQQGDGAYRVETRQGEFHAEKLVIAAGAWCGPVGELLGLCIPIVPVRGQMWATEALPPCIFHTISSTESGLQWHRDPRNDAETPPELTHKGAARVTRHLYGRQPGTVKSSSGETGKWSATTRCQTPLALK